MRTMMYHKLFPEGKVFDTEKGRDDPYIKDAPFGSVDEPVKLRITQDELIEAVVREELKKQGADRDKLDREFRKKTGAAPNYAMKSETLIKVLDDK